MFLFSLFVGKSSHDKNDTLAMEVNRMDSVKIGKYIASLRRQAGLTQEMLGEKLGVTNKTISRWENGNYMPDIEMFGLLAVAVRTVPNATRVRPTGLFG